MNIFTNTKKQKKFILILVFLMLFSFCYPKQVKAIDFPGNISSFVFLFERGIIKFINNIFCDSEHKFDMVSKDSEKVQVWFAPEAIIKGKFILFDANIFKDISSFSEGDYYDYGFEWLSGANGAKATLRNTIAGWYYSLRNFSVVALLSVLVYVGIRMITSTLSKDKAKYKIMFKDWLVALCLLVVMHYIMIATLNLTSMITDAIGTGGYSGSQTGHIMGLIHEINKKEQDKWYLAGDGCTGNPAVEGCRYEEDADGDGIVEHYTISDAFAYEVLMLAIIFYTGLFAYKYLKREFTIIFLILLGPIACITYPIDTISDGKAQAFNKWLTEFIYNVLVQPFHLLLYTVLVGSAVIIAEKNLLYAMVCFAVLIPAEKFIREMFGFKDRLGSPLGAMAAGALGGQLLSRLKNGGSGGKANSGDNQSTPNKLPTKSVNEKDLVDGAVEEGIGAGEDGDVGVLGQAGENVTGDSSNDGTELSAAEQMDEAQGERELSSQAEQEVTKEMEENRDNSGDKTPEPMSDAKSSIARRIMSAHNQRMAKKWGSSNRGRRWVNRGKKLAGGIAKTAVRSAAVGTGALALGALGFMTGQGAKGALAGAAIGSNLGNKLIKGTTNTFGDYANALRSNERREIKASRDFRGDKNQIDRAVMSYRKNHGVDPTQAQLDQEMKDRFELSRYGLSDDQIDDSIKEYHKLKQEGYTDENALKQSVVTSKLADRYNGKFDEDKKMQAALKELTNKLGGDEGLARKILKRAGDMKNQTAALPPKKIKAPAQTIETVLKSKGMSQETIQLCQECQLDLSDVKFISKIEPTNEGFKARINEIVTLSDSNPQHRTEIAKGRIDAMKIETGFNIKGSKEEIARKVSGVQKFEKSRNVTSRERELAMKAITGNLSDNAIKSMTDGQKRIVDGYNQVLRAKN